VQKVLPADKTCKLWKLHVVQCAHTMNDSITVLFQRITIVARTYR